MKKKEILLIFISIFITIIILFLFFLYSLYHDVNILGIKIPSYYELTKKELNTNNNLFPLYGNVKKTDSLQAIDEDFIKSATSNGEISKEDASVYLTITGGWTYYDKNDYETSIKRFNQAWLLNPNNYQAFWGFGLLLLEQKKYSESIEMLEKALKLYEENNQKDLLKPWYDKKIDKTLITQEQINFRNKYIVSVYESSEQMILCDLASIYYYRNTNEGDKQKALELINKATNNKSNTKNLEKCYDVLKYIES